MPMLTNATILTLILSEVTVALGCAANIEPAK